ncbi:MAG: nitric-oxide reductase large subunit, partial [Candidatus Omnitrophica bacterium]|nr:nitric-oxide reductase large subunit [Candidatus Omnitrophota bacterium]
MKYGKLWLSFAFVIAASFLVLGYYGREIYRLAPPIPENVVANSGEVLFTGQDIRDGQNVWQSIGGQQVGSVWGHGAYVAPDWSADWLHRELVWLLDHWAMEEHGVSWEELEVGPKAAIKARLKEEIRTNSYNKENGVLEVSSDRAEAIASVGEHYTALFGDDPSKHSLREAYAIPANTVKDPERQRKMNAFFFWSSWSCATNRPGQEITYTNNWPAESL